jgi:DamX protein
MQMRSERRTPFPRNGLDNYFFTTPALRLRIDLIQEYVRRGGTPVLILGEPGAGKSTLLNQLVCRADHNWRTVRMPAVRSFSADDVITFLNAELRLPTRMSAEKMLSAFDSWLERLAVRGQVAVVIVDNAHDLGDEALARLASLSEDVTTKNLCILMTGEPRLRSRLNALIGPAATTGTVPTVSIPCLDKREVASYIDMRLYHAGMEGRGPFNRTTIDDIARTSRGHPGRINAMANDVLNWEHNGARFQRTQRHIRRVMRQWLAQGVAAAAGERRADR